MDTAKALAVLGVNDRPMREFKAPSVYTGPALPIVAIPTTAGSGSEATQFTVITDSATDEKMLCIGTSFLPIAAIIDYRLTLSMPARLTADTGIDALTHAVEAYVSRKANAFSDGLCLLAIRAIGQNIRRVVADGSDEQARAAMMMAATQAGMAFSNSSVALIHGMSRPIGAHFHVAHGLSNAMLFRGHAVLDRRGRRSVRRLRPCHGSGHRTRAQRRRRRELRRRYRRAVPRPDRADAAALWHLPCRVGSAHPDHGGAGPGIGIPGQQSPCSRRR